MSFCVFCKIINREFDSAIVWEDENYLAILDINSYFEGMTLVLPKKHYHSDVFKMDEKNYSKYLLAVKKVASYIKKGMNASRVCLIFEGLEINHAHAKLYPLPQNLTDYSSTYLTKTGSKKELEELQKIVEKMKKNQLWS